MKARVNQTGIVLSVGMIVKNEEENLPNCLEALQPLLEAVPSELIIVDTGSTDATKEIAARYTDRVYDFEWIDNFSAARNETIKYAGGQWYMYLDADEWLENCDALIKFFKDADALAHYNSATLTIRNYWDHEKKGTTDFQSTRISKCLPGMRFESKIHEYLVYADPCMILDTMVNHFGYTQDDKKNTKKSRRNLPLLLKTIETRDAVNIAHTCVHAAKEYGNLEDWENAEKYSRMAVEEATKSFPTMRCASYQYLVWSLCQLSHWNEALRMAEEYFAGKKVEYLTDVDMHLLEAEIYREIGDEENAIREMETCFRLRELAEAGQLDSSDRHTMIFLYPQEKQTNTSYYGYARMMRKKNPAAALDKLGKISNWKGIKPDAFIQLAGECVDAAKAWGWYALRNDFVQTNEQWRGFWKRRIIQTLEDFPESREPMGQAFANAGEPDAPFAVLVRLYSDPEAKLQLEKLLPEIPVDIEAVPPLYAAMRAKLDIEPLVSRLDWDDMSDAAEIIGHYGDAGEVIDNYFQAYPNPVSLRGKRWKCVMQEHILLGTAPESDAGRRNFDSYCESLQEITSALYGEPDEEKLSVIPHGHRFGIFMGRASEAQKRGDIAEYVRQLKKAAEAYPIMAKPVKLRVDEISQLLEEERRRQEERELLYSQIKDKILALIRIGDLTNAAQILGQYEKINPKDTEVASLYRQIQNPEQPS